MFLNVRKIKIMKVLYDHQTFEMQNIGGVSRYFFELSNPAERKGYDAQLCLTKSENEYLKASDFYSDIYYKTKNHYNNFLLPFAFIGKYRLYRKYTDLISYKEINELRSLKEIKKQNFDVFHILIHIF
jgi:hypothetical protein